MRIKVCDFGFARATNQTREQKYMTKMGTDEWVSFLSLSLPLSLSFFIHSFSLLYIIQNDIHITLCAE
jgi:hypothetical protein